MSKITLQEIEQKHDNLLDQICKKNADFDRIKKEGKTDEIEECANTLNALNSQFKPFSDLAIIREAFDLLKNGKALDYIINTIQTVHLGDESLCKVMILSFVSTIISNTSGIQPKLTGNSGKGKSHLAETIYFLLPDEYKDAGSISAKSLYRAEHLKLGTVFFCDDIQMKEDLDSTLKRSMGNFQQPTPHITLTKENEFKKMFIPARFVWWITSVETDFSDELVNRLYDNNVDESKEMDIAVAKQVFTHDSNIGETHKTLVCRAVFSILKLNEFRIELPYGENIVWHNPGDRRNPGRFKALIQAFAALNCMRRVEKDGVIFAGLEDFKSAKVLYEINNETQTIKLTKRELRLVEYMIKNNKYLSINEIVAGFRKEDGSPFTYHGIRKAILGEPNKVKKGLLDKVPGMQVLQVGSETKYRIPGLDIPKGDAVSLRGGVSMLHEIIQVEASA
jgi:hypothetical protein